MKPIYQTINEQGRGDCMRAAVASLLELPIEAVPHFLLHGTKWFLMYKTFLEVLGYKEVETLFNPKEGGTDDELLYEYHIDRIKDYKGINGFFYASVNSPKFHSTGGTHAVIIDKDFKIVHDPNPEYAEIAQSGSYPNSEVIGYNGVRQVWVIEPII